MRKLTAVAAAATLLTLGACGEPDQAARIPRQPIEAHLAGWHTGQTLDTIATGLNNPRGLKFGPDGDLYVAEGGTGGSTSTVGQCDQVPAPIGPYTGGHTSRISRIDRHGNRTTVADHLPSSATTPQTGSLTSGVADLAFIGRTLYAILAGAGCSHGVPDLPNGVLRVNRNGTWELVADLSAFQAANPVQNPEPDDFEPDGTWYSMIAVGDRLYAVEPNHGELDRISVAWRHTARVHRVVDISATQGHIVPTVLAFHHGNFYVSNLSTFPLVPGASTILEITRDGTITRSFGRLTGVLGIAFDREGRLYALENTVCPTADPCGPTPGTGALVRVKYDGTVETVPSGLVFPTGLTLGPDGAFYVSENGFGFPPGAGQIIRIGLHHDRD
jgi:hypothetical protein